MATAKVWNDDVGSLYERALSIVPKCPLIYFAYADFEEVRVRVPSPSDVHRKNETFIIIG